MLLLLVTACTLVGVVDHGWSGDARRLSLKLSETGSNQRLLVFMLAGHMIGVKNDRTGSNWGGIVRRHDAVHPEPPFRVF